MRRSENMTNTGLAALGLKPGESASQTERIIRASDFPEIKENAHYSTLFFTPGLLASALTRGIGWLVNAFQRGADNIISRVGGNKGPAFSLSPKI